MNDYRIAGIDVHKKMLAAVVAELTAAGELAFQRRPFDKRTLRLLGYDPNSLRKLQPPNNIAPGLSMA